MTPQKDLHDLFRSLFDGPGLRQFVHFLDRKLADDLPGRGESLSTLAFATVGLLQRNGYIDQALFERLRAEFPRRVEEIDRVAARFPSSATTPTIATPQQTEQSSSTDMKISFFASNPLSSNRLALDEEVRLIEATLRDTRHRERVSFRTHWAVKPEDLQRALLEDEPVVVHFSGHGNGAQGIVLHAANADMETSLDEDTLADLFRVLKDNIRVVVLNACYSDIQARAIVREIDVVVGMSNAIGDEAARVFAAAFYRGLAFGKSVQTAFDLGLNALRLAKLGEDHVPRLLVRPGVQAAELVLVNPAPERQVGALTDVTSEPSRVSGSHQAQPGPAKRPQQVQPERPQQAPRPVSQPNQAQSVGNANPSSPQDKSPDSQSPAFRKLAKAYQNGELIAFVGAGVSRAAGLPTWVGLVEQVRAHAQDYGVPKSTLAEVTELENKGKLIEALTELEHALGKPTFVGIVKELLDDKDKEVPRIGKALAALAPNLRAVLTTNLDRLLERAFPPSWVEYHRPVANLPRERQFILKLHGTLHDATTWILTRDQYDRAMYADPRHQPIFRALMLGAPMLFVGFGLDDADLNAVLGEIRAMAQGQPPQHFALVPKPIRPGQRRAMAEAGVMLVGYDNSDGSHAEVVRVLEALARCRSSTEATRPPSTSTGDRSKEAAAQSNSTLVTATAAGESSQARHAENPQTEKPPKVSNCREHIGGDSTKIYFSDFFGVSPESLRDYGALNISLINDLPLFIDPFLLFDSKDGEYRRLHEEIIRYVIFLRDVSLDPKINPRLKKEWFMFPEVRQNWLGFSRVGNRGTGLGTRFARSLERNLASAFRDFGSETVSRSSHLEKMCLIDDGVGRDHLSDFTTNLVMRFLLEYTQKYAREHIQSTQRRVFGIQKVRFDYNERRWRRGRYELPVYENDFVLLTPRNILTRDEAWINRTELISGFQSIYPAVSDEQLRAHINQHFHDRLSQNPTSDERRNAARETIQAFPKILDYYIRDKEDRSDEAHRLSSRKVIGVESLFIANIKRFVRERLIRTEFYNLKTDYRDNLERALLFKKVIEQEEGCQLLYSGANPIKRESELHLIYRLVWFAKTSWMADNNNFSDKQLGVVFKLASNPKLERYLTRQQFYNQIIVIFHFSEGDYERVITILKRQELNGRDNIILVDAAPAEVTESRQGR